MFANKDRTIIAKYTVYYEQKIPKELESMVAYDPNLSLVKDGLSDLRGFRIPKIILSVRDTEQSANKLRTKTLEETLKTLLAERKIEHYVRLS